MATVLDIAEQRLCRIFLPLMLARYGKQFSLLMAALFTLPFALLAVLGVVMASGSRRPWESLTVTIISVVMLAFLIGYVFFAGFVDRLTNRLKNGAGIFWLVAPGLGLLFFVVTMIGIVVSAGGNPGRGVTAPVLVLGASSVAFVGYIYIVMLRAGLALLDMPDEQRAMIAEMPATFSRSGKTLVRLWGLPPTVEFARRRRLRHAVIVLVALVSASSFSLATLAGLSATAWMGLIPTLGAERASGWFFAVPAAMAVFLAIGWLTRRWVQRMVRISLEDLQRSDPREPILFLRAFRDDQIPLRPARIPLYAKLLDLGRLRTNLDELLLEEATPYGPVVALGSPSDKLPPYGAARGYFHDMTWQDAVAGLAGKAAGIVLCVDDSDGVWWEVEHLAARAHHAKTLFLVHPKFAKAEVNAKLVQRLAAAFRIDPGLVAPVPPDAGASGKRVRPVPVIGFFWDAAGAVTVLRSTRFSRFSYLLALRRFLRDLLGLEPKPLPTAASAPALATAA